MDELSDGRVAVMSWKAFTIRLIEFVRWPAALVAVAWIFREPLTTILHKLTS